MSEQAKPFIWNRFTLKQIILAATVLVAIIFTSTCAVYVFSKDNSGQELQNAQKPLAPNVTPIPGPNPVPAVPLYQKFDPEVQPKFVGLKNPKISCYVNTSVQLLYHNPLYRRLLKKLVMATATEYIGEEAHKRMQALAGFFHQMDTSEHKAVLKANSHELLPDKLTEENGQQDAQEALQSILHGVSDETIAVSITESGFYIYPDGKKEKRDPIQEFRNMIQVEIPQDGTSDMSLLSLLQKALGPEEILPEDQARKITKEYTVNSWPQILLIQLKRFRFNEATFTSSKIEDLVHVPEELELVQGDGSMCKYKLHAFIQHHGGVGGGHYIAHVRDRQSRFVCINDELISYPGQNQIDNARDHAYIYSYIKLN